MLPHCWTVSLKYLRSAPVLLLMGSVLGAPCLAQQEGASSAAAARGRYLAETGFIPTSREVAVEEFVNYHRHQIGRPKAGEAVALDVRWGSNLVSEDNPESVLQLGFSTALVNDRQQLAPINLALVIDKSGSMSDYDKMTRVKAALVVLVSQLRDTDVLSITLFDTEAQVLLPACTLTDRGRVLELIRHIEPGGSTKAIQEHVKKVGAGERARPLSGSRGRFARCQSTVRGWNACRYPSQSKRAPGPHGRRVPGVSLRAK